LIDGETRELAERALARGEPLLMPAASGTRFASPLR